MAARRWYTPTKIDLIWALGVLLVVYEAFRAGDAEQAIVYTSIVLIGAGVGLKLGNGGPK